MKILLFYSIAMAITILLFIWNIILTKYKISILKGRKIKSMRTLDIYDRLQKGMFDYYNKSDVQSDIRQLNKAIIKLGKDYEHVFTKVGEEYIYTDEYREIRIILDNSIINK